MDATISTQPQQQITQPAPKPWSAVSSNPDYIKMTPQQQDDAKAQYFKQVVSAKPQFQQLSDDDKQAAQTQFMGQDDAKAQAYYNDNSSSKFEKQLTAGMYQHVPFGKDLVIASDPNAAQNINRTPEPQSWDEKLGRFTGTALGLLPSFGLGSEVGTMATQGITKGASVLADLSFNSGNTAQIAKAALMAKQAGSSVNTAKNLGASVASGTQLGIEDKTAGASTGEAVKTGAENAAMMFGGSKLMEAVPKAISSIPALSNWTANRINSAIIKPMSRDTNFGKDPAGFLARNITSPDNTLDGWKTSVDNVVDNKVQQAKDVVQSKADQTVNVKGQIDDIYSKAMDDAAKVGDDDLLQQLINDKKTIENNQVVVKDPETGELSIGSNGQRNLSNLSLPDAIDLKRTVGKMTTSWTKGPEYVNALESVRKNVYGAIRQATEDVAPELGGVNKDIADGISASKALGRRITIENRQSFLGLYGFAGGATAVHGLFTGNMGEMAAGLATLGGDAVMKSPYVASRVAMMLSKVGKGAELEKLTQMVPWLKTQYGNIMQSLKNMTPDLASPNFQPSFAARLKYEQPQSDMNFTKNMNGVDVNDIGASSAEPAVNKEPAQSDSYGMGSQGMSMEAEGSPAIQYSEPDPKGQTTQMQTLREKPENQPKPIKDDLNYPSKIAAGIAVGAGAMATGDKAQAAQYNDDNILKAVLGEAEAGGITGQRAVASAIRNRKTLHGAYGLNSIIEKGGNFYHKGPSGERLIPKYAVLTAKQAVQDSKNKDYANGSNHWFSDADLKRPAVMRMVKRMKRIGRFGDNNFYKEG